MTDLIDPPPLPADTEPAPRPPGEWPTWLRRSVTVLALVLAVGFFTWATARGQHGNQGPADDPAVVQRDPGPGARVLQQAQVGAQLKPGYDGRVSVNGIAIPEDQMTGVAPPGSPVAANGFRPTKEDVLFLPGKGKVIEKLPSGDVTLAVRFWRIIDGPTKARTITWHIYVS